MRNIKNLDITKLKAFENHPYKVKDDEEMEVLVDSVKEPQLKNALKLLKERKANYPYR